MSEYPTFPPPSSPPPRPESTQAMPAEAWLRDPAAGTPTPPAAPPRRGRRGFAAGVVAAALVVGGGAGIGGAAAYSALADDDGSGGSSSGFTTSQVVDTPDVPAADGTVEAVAETVLPSVVKLDVSGDGEAGSGSGAILSSDGLILTNEHVAGLAGEGGSISVSFADGTRAPAEVVGTDPLTDTALVQAEGVSDLTPITIGDSESLDVGQPVVAIGSPFGLDATVTSGIVSALDRPVQVGSDGEGNSTTYPAIQTDAAINPGNSGGPLVDMNGSLVGINSSIRSTGSSAGGEAGSIGLGFAIPIDEVLPIVEQMQNGETPTHARLGVTVSDVGTTQSRGLDGLGTPSPTPGALVAEGAEVQDVGAGSAAGEAGLESGDVITRIDDTLVDSSNALVATIRSYRPGDEVEVTYLRGGADGDEQTTTLTLESDADASAS